MHLRGIFAATLALLGLATLAVPGASGAGSAIEGVWSFHGGSVAIQAQANGTFVGTVVAPTAFAQCPHPVGEQMWTGLRPQPDGSYEGLHQWYFEGSCAPNPRRGLTAWRVLAATGGSRFVRVCFSAPGSAQPTIAPDGTSANVSYGCVDSALVAPLPAGSSRALSFARVVTLPSARKCLSRREFRIHLRNPAYDPLKRVIVTLRKRRLAVERRNGRIAATIDLRGLPRGAFTVRIAALTVLGHRLSGSRTYHTCIPRSRSLHHRQRHRAKVRTLS
jgi:hypothetical protein